MEAFSELDIVMQYYGNSTQEGAHYPFNFEMIPVDYKANAVSLKALVDNYLSYLPAGRVANWVVSTFRPDPQDREKLADRLLAVIPARSENELAQLAVWETSVPLRDEDSALTRDLH